MSHDGGGDYFARAQLVQIQVDRLAQEGRTCADAERLRAIRCELEVLLESLRTIREEQLIAGLVEKPKRRWWMRLLGERT